MKDRVQNIIERTTQIQSPNTPKSHHNRDYSPVGNTKDGNINFSFAGTRWHLVSLFFSLLQQHPFFFSFALAPPKPRRKQYGAHCLLSFIFSLVSTSLETKKKIQEVWCKSMLFFTHIFVHLQEEKISSYIYIYIYISKACFSPTTIQIRNPKPNSKRKNKQSPLTATIK